MDFIYYPKCSTCQKAKKWLDQHQFRYQARDIKEEKPSYEELKLWHKSSGLDLKKFFNTSGQVYRSLKLKDQLGQMTQDQQLKLLAEDGMLVKRPILLVDNQVLIGFKEKEWEEVLGQEK